MPNNPLTEPAAGGYTARVEPTRPRAATPRGSTAFLLELRRAMAKKKYQPLHFPGSVELIDYVKKISNDTVLLSFSGGKESLSSWLWLRENGVRVVPVYLWRIPAMSFVERALRYYEDQFQTHIIRLPHPALYRWLNNHVFRPPEQCAIAEEAELYEFDYDEVFALAIAAARLPMDVYTAIGVRMTDNVNRWASIKKHGAINQERKTFYPIYDFSKERLLETIRASGIKLPADYKWFGRSFDGLDWRFLHVLRDKAPRDYKRIIELFPLAELEMFRIECREALYD